MTVTTSDRNPHRGSVYDDYAARDARIVQLQAQVFDHTGHVRRGMSRARAWSFIAEINYLRERNGWKTLDMSGRWYLRADR